jgi:hypothetical protein
MVRRSITVNRRAVHSSRRMLDFCAVNRSVTADVAVVIRVACPLLSLRSAAPLKEGS